MAATRHATPGATAIARSVVSRLADPATLQRAIAASAEQSGFPTVGWRGHTLAAGFAGTALTFGVADRCWPAQGWDRVGHRHLAAARSALEATPHVTESLFGGLAGVGYAATVLDAGRGRYARFLTTVDRALFPRVGRAIARVDRVDGCGVGDFDLISGLTGVGVYLLARRHVPEVGAVLCRLLSCLGRLLGDGREPRRWHTPADLVGDVMHDAYPHGCHNCGAAHGLPGPLALLAIAMRHGIVVDGAASFGIGMAIERSARWLAGARSEATWGPDWPNAIGLPAPDGAPPPTAPAAPAGPGRAAWCYGAPGVARALWLAGEALDDARYRDLALTTMRAVLVRPSRLTSPTFCHGVAGLLQITRRFAADTGSVEFGAAADGLCADLLRAHEPGSLLGYRNVEPGGVLVDHPGLLDGAPGVALALMAAGTPGEPVWDRIFLLG